MTVNKMRLKRFAEKFIVILFTVSLNSCSVVGQWWYDRLDIYLANYFFEYAEFTNNQKYFIRKTTKEFKSWNANSELPKYKDLLVEVKTLNKKNTSKDIEKIIVKGRTLFQESYYFFTPYIVTFCEELTDQQVDEISLSLGKRIDKWKSSLEESKNEDSVKNSIESFSRFSRFVGVKLTREQENELKRLYPRIENSGSYSIEDQKIWNTKLISILESRKKVGFQSEITLHLDSLLKTLQDNENDNVYYEMIAIINTSLNEKQREKFQRRINYFINALDKIITRQNF